MRHAVDSRQIHELIRPLPRYGITFDPQALPGNGIYFFYEAGESFGDGDRIVRVGTHIGADRLPKRLALHFKGTARRSVFRRHVGYALVNSGILPETYKEVVQPKQKHFGPQLELEISNRFAESFTFSVLAVEDVSDRLRLEAGLIASLAADSKPLPSLDWLGRHSPFEKVRNSRLWNQKQVGGQPLSALDFEFLTTWSRWLDFPRLAIERRPMSRDYGDV